MNPTQGVFFYIQQHVMSSNRLSSYFVLHDVIKYDMQMVEDALTFMWGDQMDEFREEVSYMLDQGFSAREIAVISGMHENTVYALVQEVQDGYYDDTLEGNVYYELFA